MNKKRVSFLVPAAANDNELVMKLTRKVTRNWQKLINDFCQEFICTTCNQRFYRDQVSDFTPSVESKAADIEEFTFRTIVSVEERVWICATCKRYIHRGRIPPESECNGFVYPPIPSCLKGFR